MAASLLLAPAAQGAGASRRDRRGGREDGLSAEALIVLHPGERRAAVVAELRAVLLGERAGVDGLAQHPDPGLARRRRREVRVALPAVRVRAVRGGRQENIQRAREGQGMRAHPTGGYQRTIKVAFGACHHTRGKGMSLTTAVRQSSRHRQGKVAPQRMLPGTRAQTIALLGCGCLSSDLHSTGFALLQRDAASVTFLSAS